jgi:outer membrane protein OmpA-like peptidoglycan-associated protein
MYFRLRFFLVIVVCLISGQVFSEKLSADQTEVTRDQIARLGLLNDLKNKSKDYSFEYFVLTIPANTIPGINFPIPVIHIRYKSDVLFEFDKSELDVKALPILQDLADTLKNDKGFRSLLMVGHTDSIGPDLYNEQLSQRRAVSVFAALTALGINKSLLGVVPMGEAAPIATNRTEEGRAANRRVEFFISDLAEASLEAVQMAAYEPCFRNDQERQPGEPCRSTIPSVPVYWRNDGSSARPDLYIKMGRKGVDSQPTSRPALPSQHLQRPSISQYIPPGLDGFSPSPPN